MNAVTIAEWFLMKNPVLCNGYNDENTKLNKLLYFSNLMYYAVYSKNLINEPFKKWDNGPVIPLIYSEYRYNDLNYFPSSVQIEDKEVLQILNIINFVFAEKTAKELSDETHTHSLWLESKRNENINFAKISNTEKNMMLSLFNIYKGFNFNNIGTEKVNGNIYHYDKTNLTITDEILEILRSIDDPIECTFLENIDGELVFS